LIWPRWRWLHRRAPTDVRFGSGQQGGVRKRRDRTANGRYALAGSAVGLATGLFLTGNTTNTTTNTRTISHKRIRPGHALPGALPVQTTDGRWSLVRVWCHRGSSRQLATVHCGGNIINECAVPAARGEFTAPANCTVAAALRAHLVGQSWSDLRSLCLSGKISVKGESELNPARRLAGGETVAWSLTAPTTPHGKPTRVQHRVRGRPSHRHRETGRRVQRTLRAQRARHGSGSHSRGLAQARQACHGDAALHSPSHRQGHLGAAVFCQDQTGGTRASQRVQAAPRRAEYFAWLTDRCGRRA